MAIKVQERQALRNLLEFKHKVLRKEQGLEKGHGEKRRVYEALIHVKTGDIRFLKLGQKIQDFAAELKKEGWKLRDFRHIHLIVENPDPSRGRQPFYILDEKDHEFDQKKIEKTSRKVMRETLRILNKKSENFLDEKERIEDFVLDDLTDFVLEDDISILQNDKYKGTISRIQAEKLLEKKKAGAYLIRNCDPITDSIRFCYQIENSSHVQGYLLVVQRDAKVSEYLFLEENGWFIYDDHPDLKHPSRQSFQELLDQTLLNNN